MFAFAIGVQSRIDQVMLGEMIGQEEVGHYSVAYSLIHALGFVPMALLGSFAPAITKAKSTSKELYHHRLLNFYRLMFASFLVVALPFMLFGEEFIVLFFGEPYRRAGFVLSLLSITLIFSHMGVGKSAFITNESLFRYAFATAVVGALINIGANYVLIPHYASVGAVIASIISFSVSNYVLDFFFKRTRGNIKRLLYGMLTFWKLTNIK
ncbi:MAG: hypothetical protein D6730_04170 [Bacteroidetes bacterium]|nr:MAG: hypothetical protein D6730_04170 [Bacteroidota bacterium]